MIKSVKKALDILTILSNSGEKPIPLAELAKQTALNKSTCAHIVDTMCEELYVERVSRKEGYRLGPWAYMLSRYGSYYNSLSKTAYPILKWLHKELDAAVFLSVVCNGRKYRFLYQNSKFHNAKFVDNSIYRNHYIVHRYSGESSAVLSCKAR